VWANAERHDERETPVFSLDAKAGLGGVNLALDKKWSVTVLTGTAGNQDYADGTRAAALFFGPVGLALDSVNGILYVAERGNHRIRKVRASDGHTETLAGDGTNSWQDGAYDTAQFFAPHGLALDSVNGILYVADTRNHRIRKVRTSDGHTETLAGDGTGIGLVRSLMHGAGGYMAIAGDGPGTLVQVDAPVGLALDSAGAFLYVAEWERVRKVDTATGYVKTVAGRQSPPPQIDGTVVGTGQNRADDDPGESARDTQDGIGTEASFSAPLGGVALDPASGDWYVAETRNAVIRKLSRDWQ
jgi:DNA-binding beta-propeller fold protein YncE